MNKATLEDLKFIEDIKHRKAFLIALHEVEEEGFDEESMQESVRKMESLEKAHVKNSDKVTKMDMASKAVGSTPRERASTNAFKKRKFTNTNAVDLKDYKYWRDPDFDQSQNESYKSSFSSPFDKPFDNAISRREGLSPATQRTSSKTNMEEKPNKSKSLYDELFSDLSKDHESVASKPKTNTYKEIERMLDGTQSSQSDDSKVTTRKHINKYQSPDYSEVVKKRVAKFQEMQEKKRREEEEAKREVARKKLQAEKVEKEATQAEEDVNSVAPKKATPNKLTVEVIAPEPEKKQTKTKKKSTASKPRKRKKKLDADIKLYRNIHID